MNDSPATNARGVPHSSHWGAFSVFVGDRGVEIVPHPRDRDPSALLGNIPAAVSHRARIARPMIRRGWLERGPGPDHRRGRDELVAVSWPEALDLVAAELTTGLRRTWTARHIRRLLWLGQRRALSRRAAPDPPVSEPRRRLCPLGQQLQLGCGDGDPAACDRPAGGGGRQQRQLGRIGGRERAGARLWRHGAEKQRCRRRRYEPAHRPRPICTPRANGASSSI